MSLRHADTLTSAHARAQPRVASRRMTRRHIADQDRTRELIAAGLAAREQEARSQDQLAEVMAALVKDGGMTLREIAAALGFKSDNSVRIRIKSPAQS